MFLFIVHNSVFFSLILFHGYKKQVNSASQLSLKNTGEQKEASSGPSDSVQHLAMSKHQQLGILGDYLGLLGTL